MPKPGPRTTYKYSDEFKAAAVKLSRMPGVAIKDVAESLHSPIHVVSLAEGRTRRSDHEQKGRISMRT